jgi:hypothetical protein
MKSLKQLIILIALTTQVCCNTKHKSDLQFVYSVDKEGVFIHSLKDSNVKSIYKTNQEFLTDCFTFINDTILQVGHQGIMKSEERERKVYSKYFHRVDGDSTFITDNPPYVLKDNYDYLTDSLFYINIKSGKNYLSKTIDYEHYEHNTLKIKTREFDLDGKQISIKDTTLFCSGTTSSSKGIIFCNFKRFYSKSETINGKTVTSEQGDLILKDKNSEVILLKYDGQFDPKFGSGFYNPTLTSDGEKVTFQYLAGFLKSGSCIYEMDMKTKTKKKLIGEGYFNPLYSPDNKLLLLFNNNRQSKSNTWVNDIYILDIATKTKIKVGQGQNYLWTRR